MPRKRYNEETFSRKKIALWAIGGLAAIAVISGVVFSIRWFLYKNPFFTIKQVEAIGIPKGKVAFLQDSNIFAVKLPDIYSRLRQDYPYAKKISLQKHLPNAITVRVTKRTPILVIRKNHKIYPVDEMGMALPPTHNLPSPKILEVIINNKKDIRPGAFLKDEGLFLSIDLIKALKETGLYDIFEFSTIDAREPYELRLYLKSGAAWKLRTHKYKDKFILFKKKLLNSYLEKSGQLKKGEYLLFLDDGTVTSSL